MREKIVLFAACSLLLFPGPGFSQKITIKPASAVVRDHQNKEISKGFLDLNDIKPDQDYEISAKGHETLSLRFEESRSGISFPDGLSECDPCLIEFNGSPHAEGIEGSASLKLRKKIAKKRSGIMVSISEPEIDIDDDQIIGIIKRKKIKLSSDAIHLTMGYPVNFSHPISAGLKSGYIYGQDHRDLDEDDTRFFAPKILIKPTIKSLEYRLDGKLLRDYEGPCLIECAWDLYYYTDTTKRISGITTETRLYRTSPDYNLPAHLLLEEAARDLVAIDTIYDYLERLEDEYMNGAVSEPVSISRSEDPKYGSSSEMLKAITSAVVTIEHSEGFGSGVLIDPSGIVLTCHHVVIGDTDDIHVKLKGSEEHLTGKIISMNSDYDLALIQLPEGKYPSLSLYTDTPLDIGQNVYAIGTPVDMILGQSVTKGIASGFRKINGVNFIQTDVSINAGNSGGALVDQDGRLMGITTIKASGTGIEGLGFCLPSKTIEHALSISYK